ncbi:TonB-dependent receptor [Arenibacter sp. ARW7G5Y1]|uniref:TonB-dependent receptor n=1 Tax=Arenibacter sp. ARW7G5Y1 TaxID=2135619 RepID=UPI000D871656|nr:TonB-dependent receptor [Arenibacter sp. ARW7G5Y1]PXX23718.1 TonB-linked SusC/RagA family outer membrane protein [Arenibacter sp. ARW7G5Y1]
MEKINKKALLTAFSFQLNLAMRLSLVLLMVSILSVQANEYSQKTKVTINLEKVELKKVLETIESLTDFKFLYDTDKIDEEKLVSVKMVDKPLDQVLDHLFNGTPIYYVLSKKQIVLKVRAVLPKTPILEKNNSSNEEIVQNVVSGTITDQEGQPLPGASIVEKGTTNGTQSDFDGNFLIELRNENAILVFSYVGYGIKEFSVNGQSTLNITLKESAAGLDEVVVVGFGTQKKVNLTGSVTTVDGETLTKRPVTNAASMLQGQVAGLRIVQDTGEPGNEGLSIRIRGQGTFSNAGSNPLVLIDGVDGSLSDLDPNDIDNISVLKDAASASIYGSRGANGVILVTTKSGRPGAFTVEYNMNTAIHTPTKLFDIITNSAEYMELWNEAKINTGLTTGLYPQSEIDLYRNATDRVRYPNTDWLDIMFNPAFVQSHNIGISGGSNKTHYKLSLGYVDQPGVMKGFDYKKINARLNLGSQINDFIKIGANIAFNKGDLSRPRQGSSDTFLSTMSQAPTYLPKLPDGRYTYKAYDFEYNQKNPLAILENEVLRTTTDYSVNVQGWADINLTKSINWYSKAAVVGDFEKWKDWRPSVPLYNYRTGEFATDLDVGGRGLQVNNGQNIFTNIFTYLKFEDEIVDGHNLIAQVGYSEESNKEEYLHGYRRDFAGNNLRELDAGSPAVQNTNGSTYEWALKSFFGRLGYNFKNRYLVEVNMRYDGTSRLHEDHRWGAFPSVSGAWRVSEESFMKNESMHWLNNLKIRGSYGELGNQNIGNYPYQDILDLTGNYSFDNANLSSGAAQTALSNQNITWETTKITDIGLDLTAFDGLSFTFDWYRKTTKDILRESQVTGLVGLDAPIINGGTMQNTGIELDVQYNNQIRTGALEGFRYNIGFTIDRFKNELTEFGEREIGGNTIKEEGRPWDTFYMLEWVGIFQTQAEVDAAPKQFNDNTQPGDLRYKDQNGDNIINDDDRTHMKGQYPNFEYAMNFNASWKDFDISLFFQGVEGRKVYVDNWGTVPFYSGSPPTTDWRNRWTEDNPSTTMPKIYWGFNAPDKIRRTSSYFFQDASFLRLKNISLGYNLPSFLLDRIKLKKLRIYVSGDNLLTFTNYPGLDPERGGSGRFVNYPQNKIYSLGFNVQF